MPLVATDDVLLPKVFLGEIFDCFDGDPDAPDLSSGVVHVCAGEWRREPNGSWRFWHDTETNE
jgi:hypothetical protein